MSETATEFLRRRLEELAAAVKVHHRKLADLAQDGPAEMPLFEIDDDYWYPLVGCPVLVAQFAAGTKQLLALHESSHECPTWEDSCAWHDGSEPCETVNVLARGWGWTG